MHARSMKTITLSDDAYERLKAWKEGSDSFSTVVLRVVPKRGTAADMSTAFRELDSLGADSGQRLAALLRPQPQP